MSESEDKRRHGDFLFVAAMPYLDLKEPVRDELFALLRSDDPFLDSFRSQSKAIAALMGNFQTPMGYSVTPSALLLRSGSVRNEILWEAASSLRNAFAVSCISYGWQRTAGSPNALGNLYADQYDFYPLLPSASNDDLRGMSPAQTIIDVSEHFRGQTYPDVPVAPPLGNPKPDRSLWAWLVTCWKLRYIDRVESWGLRALFRSLAYAFRAARMPKGCDDLLFDYGINIGLWYSALECLLHPEDSQVGIVQVLECLGKKGWQNHRLTEAKERQLMGTTMKLNFVQCVAHDVYRLRNNFLHGNAVSLEDLTHGETLGTGTYTHILPLVYQIAVEQFVYVNEFVARSPDTSLEKLLAKAPIEEIEEQAAASLAADYLEEALITFQLGRPRRSEERWGDSGCEEIWVTDPDGTKHRLIRKKQDSSDQSGASP
jgi:hypothetical protein